MTTDPILRSGRPVTLVGGGALGPGDLDLALSLAPGLVAADGGADALLALGRTPAAVVGDMDSLSPAAAEAYADRLHPVTEQETTDFDKALTRIEAPLVIALGFTGGRLDHELAALHSLVLRPDRPCLLLGPATFACLCPPRIAMDLGVGTLVSLFPMGPVSVASTGLRWPTDHLRFAPDRRIGTSNAAVGGTVTLRPDAPLLLLILPRAALARAVEAMSRAPRWPSPAPAG